MILRLSTTKQFEKDVARIKKRGKVMTLNI